MLNFTKSKVNMNFRDFSTSFRLKAKIDSSSYIATLLVKEWTSILNLAHHEFQNYLILLWTVFFFFQNSWGLKVWMMVLLILNLCLTSSEKFSKDYTVQTKCRDVWALWKRGSMHTAKINSISHCYLVESTMYHAHNTN